MIETNGGEPTRMTPEEFFLEHMFLQRIQTLADRYKRSVRDETNAGRFVSFSPAPGKDFYFSDSYYEAEYHIERVEHRLIHNNFIVKIYQRYYRERTVGWWIFKKTINEWVATEHTHTYTQNDFSSFVRFRIDEIIDELINYDPKDKSLARFFQGEKKYA